VVDAGELDWVGAWVGALDEAAPDVEELEEELAVELVAFVVEALAVAFVAFRDVFTTDRVRAFRVDV
jgi:hypothetical protein